MTRYIIKKIRHASSRRPYRRITVIDLKTDQEIWAWEMVESGAIDAAQARALDSAQWLAGALEKNA